MKLFRRRPEAYRNMSYFQYRKGVFALGLLVQLSLDALKNKDTHEYNHIVVGMNALNTASCGNECDLQIDTYLRPGAFVTVEILQPTVDPNLIKQYQK